MGEFWRRAYHFYVLLSQGKMEKGKSNFSQPSGNQPLLSRNCKFIPRCIRQDLKWYKRDGLLTYYDQLNYQEFQRNPQNWLDNLKFLNFHMIHKKCGGSVMDRTEKDYKTIKYENLIPYPPE